jgi:hypothetical protein
MHVHFCIINKSKTAKNVVMYINNALLPIALIFGSFIKKKKKIDASSNLCIFYRGKK